MSHWAADAVSMVFTAQEVPVAILREPSLEGHLNDLAPPGV